MATSINDWLLILLGLIAIAGLSLIVRRQVITLRREKNLQKALQTKAEATHTHIVKSLKILARCIIAEQVEYSEACIRIKVLLDNIAPELHQQADYAIFNSIYDATAHMPTHEARKSVDRRFLFKLDKQRWQLETEKEAAIKQGARNLLKHPLLNATAAH